MLISLDGYVETADRALDWFEDGDPDFERYCDEMLDAVGVALYGRRAYEGMLAYWPDAESSATSARDRAFAQKMNALPKVVLSRTLTHATWQNTRVVRDDVRGAIEALKRAPGKPIVAWAGAGLVSTLTALRLVDEYRLIVHPIVLGGGTPFFSGWAARQKLRLVRTTQLGQKLVVLCYEPLWT